MCKVEPESYEPYDVENYVNRVLECLLNPAEAVSRITYALETYELSKHHVVPEVEEVEQQTEQNDDTEYEHVL